MWLENQISVILNNTKIISNESLDLQMHVFVIFNFIFQQNFRNRML